MKFSWIEPNRLAASAAPFRPADLEMLHEAGIQAVLTLTEEPLTLYPGVEQTLAVLDMQPFHVPIPDDEAPTPTQADQILRIINDMEQAGRPILVHCMFGMRRTGTALHLYYLGQGLTMAEAHERVVSRRSVCANLTKIQRAFLEEWVRSRDGDG